MNHRGTAAWWDRLRWPVLFMAAVLLLWWLFLLRNYFFDPRGIFRESWYLCVEYLKSGTLYGGQPVCVEGIGFYSVLLMLQTAVGVNGLADAMVVLLIAVNAGVILLLTRMIQRETGKWYGLQVVVLFGLLVSWRYGLANPTIMFASFWFCLGWYLQEYVKFEKHDWLAGTCYALAVLTHATTLALVVVMILVRTFRKIPDKTAYGFSIKRMLPIVVPLGIVFGLLSMWRHQYLVYTVLVGTKSAVSKGVIGTLLNILLAFLHLPWVEGGLLTLFLLTGAWLARKERWARIAMVGSAIMLLSLCRITDSGFIPRFFISVFALILVAAFITYGKGTRTTKIALLSIATIGVLVIGAELYVNYEQNQFRDFAEAAFGQISLGEGPLLTQDTPGDHTVKYLIERTDTRPIPVERLAEIGRNLTFSDDQQRGFEWYGIVENASAWNLWMEDQLLAQDDAIGQKILNGTYSTIVAMPPYQEALNNVLREVTRERLAKGVHYCRSEFPYLYYSDLGSQREVRLYIRAPNEEECLRLYKKMQQYYDEHMNQLCTGDSELAKRIAQVYSITEPLCKSQDLFNYHDVGDNEV